MDKVKALLNEKTLKREVAAAALLFWAAITYRLFWGIPPEYAGNYEALYGSATTMIWVFAGAAFGLDHLTKKGVIGKSV